MPDSVLILWQCGVCPGGGQADPPVSGIQPPQDRNFELQPSFAVQAKQYRCLQIRVNFKRPLLVCIRWIILDHHHLHQSTGSTWDLYFSTWNSYAHWSYFPSQVFLLSFAFLLKLLLDMSALALVNIPMYGVLKR